MKRKFIDLSIPFSEFYKEQQEILYNKLVDNGVSAKMASEAVNSGYYMRDENSFVYDSYYAPIWLLQGQFGFSEFLEILDNRTTINPIQNKVSVVRSPSEILEVLRSDPHSRHCLDNGSFSFRGQTAEYFTKRPIPNPSFKIDDNGERLIIPNIYRKYKDDFQQRLVDEQPHKIFNTSLADDLIYYGMENPMVLSERNYKKYGPHTISDLENFPEPENQEYYKRWSQIKVQGTIFPDIAIVSQHYGFHTYGLDITFDHKAAAFFATNKFGWTKEGKADYSPIKNGEHSGVIYCFYFRAPQITSTRDIIHSIPAFEYINPVRPIRQSCALPFFLSDRFNEANQFIWHIFKLHHEFNTKDIPSKTYFFPSKEEDKFYKAAIEVKQKNESWSDFVEYGF